jgi:hypothetical protein
MPSFSESNWKALAVQARDAMEKASPLLNQAALSDLDRFKLLDGIRSLAQTTSDAGLQQISEDSFREKLASFEQLAESLRRKLQTPAAKT